jgi:DNA-binding winged helix-turn-helix (wHTH) protein
VRVRCDRWVLDTATRQVTRGRKNVHITPKAFELLTTLLAERPRAVSKLELQERLWPDTFVSEANLAGLVTEIRSALGDTARRPTYIRTVHRYGYAFCGEATEEHEVAPPSRRMPASARLILGRREVALNPGDYVLGRTQEAAVWIDSVGVSRRHARVSVTEIGCVLEDLGSKNGTFVNGTRLARPHRLKDGDGIRLGSVQMTFRTFAAPPSTETEAEARVR